MKTNIVHLGDNLEFLKTLSENSVDTIITDSPYGLSKKQNIVKVLLAWCTTGFLEILGRGFMGKKWDSFVPQPNLWKEAYRVLKPGGYCLSFFGTRTYHLGTVAMEIAGFEIRDMISWIYGSGFPKSKANLKPACEPICVARKPGPLIDLNIDNCRIGFKSEADYKSTYKTFGEQPSTKHAFGEYAKRSEPFITKSEGRWPSNVILDEESAGILDQQSGISGGDKRKFKKGISDDKRQLFTGLKATNTPTYNDIGGASRFFYVAKASPSERNGSKHPTVKPIKLMRQLVKLYSPVGGVVLDMHCGSGKTGEACVLEGRDYILCDNDPQSVEDTKKLISKHNNIFTKEVA